MAPNIKPTFEEGLEAPAQVNKASELNLTVERKWGIVLHRFITGQFILAHVSAVWIAYLFWKGQIPWGLLLFQFVFGYIGNLGVTVGAHRYWTHKTYKATFPLQILLMIMQTLSIQDSIYKWALDHRMHHKHTDTDIDPHSSKRGFWFSHMTWLFQPCHLKLIEKRRTFDMPDLEKDPVVMFQHKHYTLLSFLICGTPAVIAYYIWGDTLSVVTIVAANHARWVYMIHAVGLVNSVAHIWGTKPYDKSISSVDNRLVSFLFVGEGWHNYHHAFPWDYRTSEWGSRLSTSTMLIDFFAWMGWAYELKTVSKDMVKQRVARTGSGTAAEEFDSTSLWGWDDEKMTDELRKTTTVLKSAKEIHCE